MQLGGHRGHVLAEVERDLARDIALAQLQVDHRRVRLGLLAELGRRRAAELQMQRLTFKLAAAGQGQALIAARATGRAAHLVEMGGGAQAGAVRQIADRGIADLELTDLGNDRPPAAGRLELPVGRAVGAGLEANRRLLDAELGQLDPAVQERWQVEYEFRLLHRQHRLIARPRRVGEPGVVDRDPGPQAEVDIEVARDLERPPEAARDLIFERALQPVPVEQQHEPR